MQQYDTITWLPYMFDWYEKYEYLGLPFIKIGLLKEEILIKLQNEIDYSLFKTLDIRPKYATYNLFSYDGNLHSSYKELSTHNTYTGWIKSVQADTAIKCNINAPTTFNFLRSFENLKRTHYSVLYKNQYLNTHADNPYQEGLKFHINLTGHEGMEYSFNGVEFNILPGEIFWLNSGVPHRVANNGSADRINLILDIEYIGDLNKQIDTIKHNLIGNGVIVQ